MIRDKKLIILERISFLFYLIGMVGAGYIYENLKDEISSIYLLVFFALYMVGCYAGYKFLLAIFTKKSR
jgi:hypothetical protein